MTDPKPLLVFWSKAAVDAASTRRTDLHATLVAEATDLVSKTTGWFSHVFTKHGDDGCFLATAHELPDRWEILVQIAIYKPLKPLADDHPMPDLRGKVFKMAEAVDEYDNQIFAEFKDLSH